MIASSGFFKDIYCPFLKVGLCERAHCHFSHDKPNDTGYDVSSETESEPVYIPTPISKIKSTQKTSDERTLISKIKSTQKTSDERKPGSSRDPVYEPTPISELKKLKDVKGKQERKKSDADENKERRETSSQSKTKSIKAIEVDIFAVSGKSKKSKERDLSKERDESKRKKSRSESEERRKDERGKHRESCESSQGDSVPSRKKVKRESPKRDSKKEQSADEAVEWETPASAGRVRTGCDVSRPAVRLSNKRLTAKEVMLQRFQSKSSTSREEEEEGSPCVDLKAPIKRVAHSSKISELLSPATKPGSKEPKRPTMPLDVTTAGKIPIVTRQAALSRLIDECLKLHDSQEKAYDRALREEKAIYDRVKSKMMYPNATASAILKLREEGKTNATASAILKLREEGKTNATASAILKLREEGKTVDPEAGNQSPSKSPTKTVSHEQMLNGPNFVNCGFVKKRPSFDLLDLPPVYVYDFFKKFLMKEEDLKSYGYPLPDPLTQDRAISDPLTQVRAILPRPDSKSWNDFKELVRVCCRCKKRFQVSEEGIPINRKDVCVYHGGRIWSEKSHGILTKIYSCCKQEVSSGGCCSSDFHVVDGAGHPDYDQGFVQTRPRHLSPDESPGIFALDCEMCNTTIGMELTRISVVDLHCKIVYESLVKPKNLILDYNTKFSGIKKGDLDQVTTTIEDVQKKLLHLFNDRTILIGHSLESDLKALKLIHLRVIDTAQVFPHRRGLPFKRALRTIVAEVCREIIQDDARGHDSFEDATSCMKLIIMKATDVMNKFRNQPALIQAVESERMRRLSSTQ